MKTKTSIFASFVVGAAIASLPYTLSSGKTFAQGAGPALAGGQSGFPPQGGQGFPGQGGQQGFPGQGGPGQPNQMQQMQMAMSIVQSMTSSGNFLFAASGDTIYKINMNSMQLEGQVKLPHPQNQPQNRQGGQGQVRGGANGRPGQGLGGGGGAIPPK